MCGATHVLSQESLDLMHGDRVAQTYDGDAWSEDTGYGMGWWIDRESGCITDGGAGLDQMMLLPPSEPRFEIIETVEEQITARLAQRVQESGQ